MLSLRVLILFVTGFVLPWVAYAEQRYALVIGNSAYQKPANGNPQYFGALVNPTNDARLMKRSLEQVGFEVELLLDATEDQMQQAFVRHGMRLNAAGPDGVGMLYFAGHGVQSQGLNYLIPVDIDATTEQDLWRQAPRLGDALQHIRTASSRVNFIILDACRSNGMPTAFRSSGTGLAPVARAHGLLVSYSTAPGSLASDGAGENSPYTQALSKYIQQDGLIAEQVFKRVADEVYKASNGAQMPFYNSGLVGEDFCFGDCDKPTAVLDSGIVFQLSSAGRGVGSTDEAIEDRPLTKTPEGSDIVAGASFKDCETCPEMTVLSAGEFNMGSPDDEFDRKTDEGPQRLVSIDRFAIGKYEVTFGQFDACRTAGACAFDPRSELRDDQMFWASASYPVMNVNADDAQEFIDWLNGQVDGEPYRLPSEAEWEYAARAGTSTPFSTGDGISSTEANYNGQRTYDRKPAKDGVYLRAPVAVGSYAPNAFGLHDVHGNVAEWTADCYRSTYAGLPPTGDPIPGRDGCGKAVRGGDYEKVPSYVRSATRDQNPWLRRDEQIGFRVAKTLD